MQTLCGTATKEGTVANETHKKTDRVEKYAATGVGTGVGAFLGGIVGGPLGAAVGATIGGAIGQSATTGKDPTDDGE